MEVCDGVQAHSLLGKLKPGDILTDVHTRAIAPLADGYFCPETVIQSGYPRDRVQVR